MPVCLSKRFLRDRSGATAVEFALVAPMLFALIFSTMEAGWTMVQTIMLDHAVDSTVRQLRIGSLVDPSHATVRASICASATVLVDCHENLTVEMVPIVDASSYPTDAARCVNRASAIDPVLRFNPGQRSQTVFVRACFVVDPLTPFLGLGLALPKDATGAYRILAKSGFVNEPG